MATKNELSKWVQEQTVLMTGCTGFLGQALLHKLLSVGCPKIYVLIRAKRNKTASQRLDDLMDLEIFKNLQQSVPNICNTVIAVPFDTQISGIDINEEDRQILINEVTFVVHEAASTKFDDELKAAILTNIRITRDLLMLAKEMKKFQCFHYVSTAFSNFNPTKSTDPIEEKLYKPKMNWKMAIEAAETVPSELLNSLEKKLIGSSPNTYTFSKQLTESLVGDFGKYYPVVISRPTVVFSAVNEPSPGWIASLNSPVAVMYGGLKGVMRCLYGKSDNKTAYIHVDYVTNLTITSSWYEANNKRLDKFPVYNANYFAMPINKYEKCREETIQTNPVSDPLWYPFFYAIPNPHVFLLAHLLLHFLPGLLIDGTLKMCGRKPRLLKLYRKLYITMLTLYPFASTEPIFQTTHTDAILKQLSEESKSEFSFELPNTIPDVWKQYERNTVVGAKKAVNEPPQALKSDIEQVKRLYFLHMAVKLLFIFIVAWNFPYTWIFRLAECITNFNF